MPFLYAKTEYRGEDCIEITGSTSETRSLTIPDTIEEMPVRSIGRHAFAARNDLQEISLPPTMKRLCRFAFHNCRNLRKIRLTARPLAAPHNRSPWIYAANAVS